MSSQPRIADKFRSIEELSFEPIGCYYKAVLNTKETVLILVLNKDFSNIARKQIELLISQIQASYGSLIDIGMVPVIDIIDCLEGVILVMPYFAGITLAEYINHSKPLGINSIKKFIKPMLVSLSNMHKAGGFHGFINFSTTWVTDRNQVVILGSKIFNIIFNNIRYINTSLDNSRVISCINNEVAIERIKCSIYADYYSILVIIRSMLLGYITNNNSINNSIIAKTLSNDTRVYLTKTFCNKIYNNFVSVNDWIDRIKPVKFIISLNFIKTSPVLLLAIFGLVGMVSLLYVNLDYSIYTNKNKPALVAEAPTISPIRESNKTQLIQRFNNFTDNSPVKESITNIIDNNVSKVSKVSKVSENKIIDEKSDISQITNQEEYQIQKYYKDLESQVSEQKITIAKQNIVEPNNDRRLDDKIAFKGPKVTEIQVADKKELVMASPISKEDYYTFCYLDSSCKLDWQIDKKSLIACLFERECDQELYAWLSSPMEFTSSTQVDSYLAWLNSHKEGHYDIIPDYYWTMLAGNFNPDQNCEAINDNKFKVYSQYPEWVKINKNIALRGPVYLLADQSQCQVAFDSENTENYAGKMLVRLVKTA